MSNRRKRRNKKDAERSSARSALRAWQLERLERDRDFPLPAYGPSEVTLLAYHFFPEAESDAQFPYLECAIRETWRHCGFLRTVIVANARTAALAAFAEPFKGQVEIQVEPSLVPGRKETMYADINARLPERFATPFVLVVESDGFPIRPGLGAFLDKGDYWGAPLSRGSWWRRFLSNRFNVHPMAGGLSLRSRKACELVAAEWKARAEGKPWKREYEDNLFFTKLLPRLSFAFRHAVFFPASRDAVDFAFDAKCPFKVRQLAPFGFHGPASFLLLRDGGKVM